MVGLSQLQQHHHQQADHASNEHHRGGRHLKRGHCSSSSSSEEVAAAAKCLLQLRDKTRVMPKTVARMWNVYLATATIVIAVMTANVQHAQAAEQVREQLRNKQSMSAGRRTLF